MTKQTLLHNKSGNGLVNNLKALKNTITDVKLAQDSDTTLLPRRIRLRHHTGKPSSDRKSNRSWDCAGGWCVLSAVAQHCGGTEIAAGAVELRLCGALGV